MSSPQTGAPVVEDDSLDEDSSVDDDDSSDEDSGEDSLDDSLVALEDSPLVVGSDPDVSGSMPDELSVFVTVLDDSLLPGAELVSEPSVSTGVASLGQPARTADTSTTPTRGNVQFMRTTVPAARSVGKRSVTSSAWTRRPAQFRRQISALSAVANATHAAYGTIIHAALRSTRLAATP
jgi:hypothetical protein